MRRRDEARGDYDAYLITKDLGRRKEGLEKALFKRGRNYYANELAIEEKRKVKREGSRGQKPQARANRNQMFG